LLPIVVNDTLNCRAGNNVECRGGWHFGSLIALVSDFFAADCLVQLADERRR